MSAPVVDRQWFMDKLSDGKKSVRGLARHLSLDPSAVSRMLSGQRRMRMTEIGEIARFLNVDVEEVLRHAGVAIDEGKPSRVLLTSVIGESGEIEPLDEARPLPQNVVSRAKAAIDGNDEGPKIIAAQVRSPGGALGIWDDAIVLFHATTDVEPTSIGVMSIVRTREGVQILAHVERARKTGEATLRLPAGELRDVMLQTATPVLAVLP